MLSGKGGASRSHIWSPSSMFLTTFFSLPLTGSLLNARSRSGERIGITSSSVRDMRTICHPELVSGSHNNERSFMKRGNILIADDDLDLLSVIDWNLNKLGYRTTVAIDGLEAMKKIGESRPDLLTLELGM